MADLNIGAKISVDAGNAVEAVKSVRSQLKDATNDLYLMQDRFGEMSKPAIEAAKRVAELRDKIGDAKAFTDAFNPDRKFAALGQSVQGVIGGFSALQGVMGLVGGEGAELEKMLLKVQSAMALSQGLDTVRESVQGFKTLGTIIGNNVTKAFSSLKAAIASTGIGLLVVALGAVAANWDKIMGLVSGVTAQQRKAAEAAKAHSAAENDKLATLEGQDNILKLQGKSEKEILGLKIKQTDEVIASQEQELALSQQTLQSQLAAEVRNKSILKGILEFITSPLQLLIDTVAKVASYFGKDWNFNIAESFSSMVFDPEETKKKGEAEAAEIQKTINELKNKRAGFQLSIRDINKKGADQQKTDNDKQIAEDKRAQADLRKILEESALMRIANEDERRRKELQFELQHNLDMVKESTASNAIKLQLADSYKEQYLLKLKEIDDKEKAAELARQQTLLKTLDERKKAEMEAAQSKFKDQNGVRNELEQEAKSPEEVALDKLKEVLDRRLALVKGNASLEFEVTKDYEDSVTRLKQASGMQRLQVVGGLLGRASELIGKQTAAGKALGIAEATISTYTAAAAALATVKAAAKSGNPFAAVVGIANAALIIGSGIKSIKEIAKTPVPGGGGGGASIPSEASLGMPTLAAAPLTPQPQTTNTSLDQATINGIGNAAGTRAYVIDRDITNGQERQARLERAARLD